jgi:hypothetical protein
MLPEDPGPGTHERARVREFKSRPKELKKGFLPKGAINLKGPQAPKNNLNFSILKSKRGQ